MPVQIGILAGVGGSYKLGLEILQCFHLGTLTSQTLHMTPVCTHAEERPGEDTTSRSHLQAQRQASEETRPASTLILDWAFQTRKK